MEDSNEMDERVTAAKTPPATSNLGESLRIWRQTILHGILRTTSVIATVALIAVVIMAVAERDYSKIGLTLAIYIVLLMATFTRGVAYGIQAGVIVSLLYFAGVNNLVTYGYGGNAVPFLIAVPVVATLLFGRRAGYGLTALVIITLVVFAVLFVTGILSIPTEVISTVGDLGSWISHGLALVLLTALLILPLNFFFQHFTSTITHEQEKIGELEDERVTLAETVLERTQAVTRRARYLEASAVVAREAASAIENIEELFTRVVNLISDQFGFYHTGLFINDVNGEWTELKAASSSGGLQMLSSGHRLLIGSQGIVGHVAQGGQSRVALDVGEDAVFFNNPVLPDTRSEIALPLLVRGEVIGVLDVQSTEKQAFTVDDIAVLQSLANQVALAISNARLFTLAQESIETERRLRGELTSDGWRRLLEAEQNLSARSTSAAISTKNDGWHLEREDILHTAEPIIVSDTQKRIVIPLRVAGQTIGVVAARKPQHAREWTTEEVAILSNLTEQLNAAVERARLYRQAQMIASRQKTITEVGARMRSSLQIETVLQTAANEIREALHLGDVEIRLRPPAAALPTDGHLSDLNEVNS